jgi:CheY-like chemotaxis protein
MISRPVTILLVDDDAVDTMAVSEPLLILLDLNMPRMGGIEFLKQLRDDPLLRRTLVFVITTSSGDEDRRLAYEKNVAGYFLKRGPKGGFLEAIGMLERYWRTIEFPK